MTASSSASKIADRRSRSDDSAPKVSRSAIRIVSRARPRSAISSRPPVPWRGSSSLPSVIRAALPASRLTRVVIAVAIRKPITTAARDRDCARRQAIAANRVDGAFDLPGRSARASTAPEMRPSRMSGTEATVTTPGSRSTVREPRRAAAIAACRPGTWLSSALRESARSEQSATRIESPSGVPLVLDRVDLGRGSSGRVGFDPVGQPRRASERDVGGLNARRLTAGPGHEQIGEPSGD